MKLHKIAFILLIVGGLNWGLEAFGYGVGQFIPSGLSMTIYILVALAALYEAFGHKNLCRHCNAQGSMM